MRLSIIVPAHNEEENIEEAVKNIEAALNIDYDLVVVNDHSRDATPEIVLRLSKQYPNLRLVDNPDPAGFANALKTGFRFSQTELVVPVMADLCDDLSTIEKMLEKINAGYDIACGCRYAKGGARSGGSKLKGFLSFFAGWSLHYLLGIPTFDIANAFKMYRKKVIDSIDIQAKGFEISMEIALKAYYLGYKITDVSTLWKERTRGKSTFKVFELLPGYIKLYLWGILKRIRG